MISINIIRYSDYFLKLGLSEAVITHFNNDVFLDHI